MTPRELLIEIGLEEVPASWLPALTRQLGERLAFRLKESRLAASEPEALSTPRRLVVSVERLADHQDDLEETITGPPVSAAIGKDGQPTPAGLGFARKQGVAFDDLARVLTPKGEYLAYRRHERGRPASDVLPDVLAAVLRDLTFPKLMRWDARLDDGRGELLFGRPIRWLLFLYGGRVVPFVIRRSPDAAGPQVQDVASGAVTFGHRFLASSGRPGRAIRVKSVAEYRKKLAERFVVLDRTERRDCIARELETRARRLGGRVMSGASSSFLDEVPDLVEYPGVVSGRFAQAFLTLPPEVLTTTMIHHQHYFPVVDETDSLKPVFLAVTNTQPPDEKPIVANAERVLAARLRDASFFWEADRRTVLEARLDRLDTVLFHKALGSYRRKAERMAALAEWIAREVFQRPDQAEFARHAALVAKADLTTDMVGEFPELQGVMGGIYAREEGQPEEIWKAIYHHYLPVGVEADAPPSRRDLGAAAITWAAVSLADKLDTVVGLFGAGERPTGSRDPFGLRRQALGAVRILTDLPELTGLDLPVALWPLVERAGAILQVLASAAEDAHAFIRERFTYALGQRGMPVETVRAVVTEIVRGGLAARPDIRPLRARRIAAALQESRASADFEALAILFKRVKNIAREIAADELFRLRETGGPVRASLSEPAELALVDEMDKRRPAIERAAGGFEFGRAFAEVAALRPAVDRFFTEVFVMVDDAALRQARLRLMADLRDMVLDLADISEVIPQAES